MKKLSLLAAIAVLAATSAIHALNSTDANSPTSPLPLTEANASHSASATKAFAAFNRYHTYIDHSFQRLKSIQQAALELHTSVAAMNKVFRPYAHEDANRYLMSLKRTQTQTDSLYPQNEKLVAYQQNTQWPDAYVIGQ